ncbi:DUF4286 family protein [Lysobacter humi (ex Lee et al. 2017)]
MHVYEVDIEIDAAIEADYLAWLRPHIAEIVALPGFTGATLHAVLEPAPASACRRYCVQYRLVDAAALEAYLRDHAPRLRADGIARFGERMRATRRVMQALDA